MENKDIKKFYFSEKVAIDVGVEEAIMFHNIYFWVRHNAIKEYADHYHKEKYWMYNTVRDFAEQYPYWTPAMIKRILGNLKKKDFIEIGVFNKYGYDKTKWYTIAQKGIDIIETDEEYIETVESFG